MIRTYTLLLLFICITSFAEEVNTSPTVMPTNTVDSTLIRSNEIFFLLQDSTKTVRDSIVPTQKMNTNTYPPQFRDYRRLGYNSAIFAGAAVVGFSVLWSMPERVTHWNKEQMREKGIFWKWNQNIKTKPVWDKDNWVLNWVTHPYCGGVYYMTARSSGFSRLESFGYSAIMSTFFWEYGIEAFAEVPSVQDLVITPVVGSVVGEGFFYAKKLIVRHDHKILKSKVLGYTALVLMDPFNTILDAFGYKEKVKTQMNIAPVGVNQFSKTAVWGVSFSASF